MYVKQKSQQQFDGHRHGNTHSGSHRVSHRKLVIPQESTRSGHHHEVSHVHGTLSLCISCTSCLAIFFTFVSGHLWTFCTSVFQVHQPAEFNQFVLSHFGRIIAGSDILKIIDLSEHSITDST